MNARQGGRASGFVRRRASAWARGLTRALGAAPAVSFLLALPVAAGSPVPVAGLPSGASPLTVAYDRDLGAGPKWAAIESTVELFATLGIELRFDGATLARVETAAGGTLDASVEDDVDSIYDTIYYLTDLVRLPPSLHALYPRLLVVGKLHGADPRSGKLRRAALAREPSTGFILVDHAHFNQLEMFGGYMHPKVSFAMLLQVAIEQRLAALPAAALDELGLAIVIDDAEWARLNGPKEDGFAAYTGEELAFVGLKSTLRLTPPGILYDAVRETQTGVPADAYVGLAEPNHPWWSPRHGPAADRQGIMRSLFSNRARYFERMAGTSEIRADAILKEKTRLILYGAFVASGGYLDHSFWTRRHPGSSIVAELTRDFDARFLADLDARLAGNDATRDVRIGPVPRQE